MAKKQIKNYVFEPGISKNSNLYPNAVALLIANKAFLQAQVVAFINDRIANNIAPYVGYTYAPQKCTRDVGFFIDAVIHDLRYGGNVATRQVSEYFWIDGFPMIRGDVAPEITGQQYLRDTINNFIFTNTTVSPTYGQTSVVQTRYTGANAETGSSTRNSTLWNIFGDVITNGTPNIPAKVPGVSSIKLMGRYEPSDVLLITNTNSGDILYNFADPANNITFSYKTGRISSNNDLLPDLDFPAWSQKTDTITTIYLSKDTSDLQDTTDIQIFVEEPYQTIRPWDFGTDAIERMRVASPQAMLDADFEYGLQPTKWQALGLIRSYPSTYEVPGTDLAVTAVTTDASVNTGGFGSSLITVTTSGSHGFSAGSPITVKGYNTAVNGFSRAEGTFLVYSVPTSSTFTYYSSAKVGVSNGESLFTSFVQIRQAAFYTGSSIGQPQFSVASNGSNAVINSRFDTPSGSFQLSFSGTSPTIGSPISGSPLIPAGTSISGVTGAGSVVANVKEDVTETSSTSVKLVDFTGVLQQMAIDNGSGDAIFITSITNDTATLSGPIGQTYDGANGTTEDVTTGSNIQSIGTNASFNVSRSGGNYTVTDSGDSSSNGQDYVVGDRILIPGTSLGGASPANDLTLIVSQVDSGGAIVNTTTQGTAISGGDTYNNVGQTSSTFSGLGATLNVIRLGGTGQYTIELESGGSGYVQGETITFAGTSFGGVSPDNNIVVQVDGVSFPAGAVVDFTIVGAPVGASGDDTYTSVTGTNVLAIGSGASFDVERLNGNYIVTLSSGSGTGGSGYFSGGRILIQGSALSGTNGTNDCTLTISNVDISGRILSVTATGTPFAGDEITVYPSLTLSEPITGAIADGTLLNVGAIATIEVSFTTNHGLVPGTTILTNITSTPAPEFASTAVALPSSGTWTGVDFVDGVFVAVRSGSNQNARSIDGALWGTGGNLPSSAAWSSVAGGYIGNTAVFVAVSTGGTAAAYSADKGISWSATSLPSSGTWSAVHYYGGYFVAVRSGSNAGAYSTDGQSWQASTLPATANWADITTGVVGSSTVWVTVASASNTAAYSVDNGVSWVAMGNLPANTTWSAVEFGNNRFFAVASGGTQAAISTNGTTWSSVTLPTSANWNCIAYGDDNFVVIANGGTQALTSFTGETGSFTDRSMTASSSWEEIAYGFYTGVGTFAVVGSGTQGLDIDLTSANHQLAAGPFVVTQIPSLTTLRYAARTTGSISTAVAPLTGIIYARPDSFFVHRPFDGGVQLGTGSPVHSAQAVRQSKKYIRYQSGKGIMYTTGGLFAPSYNLSSATAVDTVINSFITFTCDDTDHGLQTGAIVEVIGCNSFEYNGEYIVESIVDARRFRVRSNVVLSTLNASLSSDAKVVMKNWHGSCVRIGAFDDQNGIFYQYDGQQMTVVKRSSTNQLTGTISLTVDNNIVSGSGTKFQDQLRVGDKIVIRGMTHSVTGITSQTAMTVSPDWRGSNNITGAKMCITLDQTIFQEDWNLDRLDGTGPSGYELLPWRMQMLGIQYSWYAAGFIEFMLRGADGRFVFLHKIRNSNVNTEAYMRTANLPVRYEVENIGGKSELMETITSGQNTLRIKNARDFPQSGTVYIDNELITYSGKNGNILQGLSRASSMSSFVAGQNRAFTAGPAASHTVGAGVILVSCTCTPTISHWGSALLTDGQFDEDRGYLFNYAATGLSVSTTKQTAFMIRLAPSVSNALVGDLGERDLLNRAQLLLDEIGITADTGTGAIIVEGVLNPRNYPSNPANIIWNGLSSSGAGGQPSFAQIALGGSVNWGGTPITTTTATINGAVTATFTARAVTSGADFRQAFRNDRNTFIMTTTDFDVSFLQIGDILSNATFLVGNRTVTNIQRNAFSNASVFYTIISMSGNGSATSAINTNITYTAQIPQTAASYLNTNYLFFTQASWNSSSAAVGTRVAASYTQFPAGTSVQAVQERRLFNTIVRRVTFTQNSNTTLSAAGTVTFEFGDPQYALPGEQIFSFVTNPGERATLSLEKLKELTTTSIGGRGTFPNGPDVLAINLIKVSGTAVPGTVVLRWSEAQA